MDLSDISHRPVAGSGARGGNGAPGAGCDSKAVTRAIRAFQAGIEREESFRVLFETYRPTVQRFFLRRLASAEASRDLTQETFLKVYKGLKGYRGDGPFGAWLFRIAWNVLRSQRSGSAAARLRAREVQMEDLEMEVTEALAVGEAIGTGEEPRALAAVLREEQRRVLRGAIEKLPPQRRKCVVLWAYHELTYEQIAVVMRLSIGTIKAHLAQARAQLGRLVADVEHDLER
jgi:RNA polymerase sigma-70 factor (ECF subfamily)